MKCVVTQMVGYGAVDHCEGMQISRDNLTNATSTTLVGRRYDFLSRVILDVKVQHGTAADQLESPERIAALVEAERLLREVTELFEQRFE